MTRYTDAATQAASQGVRPEQAEQAAAVARATVPTRPPVLPSTAIAELHAAVGTALDDLDPAAVLAERAAQREAFAPRHPTAEDLAAVIGPGDRLPADLMRIVNEARARTSLAPIHRSWRQP